MIHMDQDAEPSGIARTLWFQQGPKMCIALALSMLRREVEQRIVDVIGSDEDL